MRFYLTIGRLENSIAFNDGLISMLHASRHVRDVLQAKGYDLTLRETNGGHDPYNWEAALPDALAALLASSLQPPFQKSKNGDEKGTDATGGLALWRDRA